MVHRFAEVFGTDRVHRGFQYRDGYEVAAVVAPAFHLECKRGLRSNPCAALAQTTEDSLGKGLWPIAVCKEDPTLALEERTTVAIPWTRVLTDVILAERRRRVG